MSDTTGGYTEPTESFQHIVWTHYDKGVATNCWQCSKCNTRVEIPYVEWQDLICPKCGYQIPFKQGGLELVVSALPGKERHKFFAMVEKAMMWKGWDRRCGCHACDGIRDVAKLMLDNGKEFPEYT